MLTKRQLQVARALFEGQLAETEIIEKYKISPKLSDSFVFERGNRRYCLFFVKEI
jgi:hypothetical protein